MVLKSASALVCVTPAGVTVRPVAVKRTGWPARESAGSAAGGVTSSAQAASSRRRAGRARRMVLYILVIVLFLDMGTWGHIPLF